MTTPHAEYTWEWSKAACRRSSKAPPAPVRRRGRGRVSLPRRSPLIAQAPEEKQQRRSDDQRQRLADHDLRTRVQRSHLHASPGRPVRRARIPSVRRGDHTARHVAHVTGSPRVHAPREAVHRSRRAVPTAQQRRNDRCRRPRSCEHQVVSRTGRDGHEAKPPKAPAPARSRLGSRRPSAADSSRWSRCQAT